MPGLDEAVFSVDTVHDMRAVQQDGHMRLVVDCFLGSETKTKQCILRAIGQDIEIAFASLGMRLKKRRIETQFGE